MLIIGCGNRERGDDAAGLLVIEKLRELGADGIGATLATCSGDITELIESWRPEDEVIIIDAVVTGSAPGSLHLWEAALPTGTHNGRTSTHGFGIHEALRLARVIDRLPRTVRIYGIEAGKFEAGGCLSLDVEQAIINVTQKIRTEILSAEAARLRPSL